MVAKRAKDRSDLSPSDIRRIREGLRLTQVEAGELLGGGPRAFAKYENGAIKPAASVSNLLRLLEKSPESLTALTGIKSQPIDTEARRPFEVTPEHIKALSPKKFSILINHLLSAEAFSSEIPRDGLHVAAQITVADGGEDARIEWSGGSERTEYIPARLTVFQLKATALTPAKAGKDVVTKDGQAQPMIKKTLEIGGAYVMLVSYPAVKQSMHLHENAIRDALRAAHLDLNNHQIAVRDGRQIADWVNKHPSVSIWVLEQTQPGLVGPFRDWLHWASRDEHESSPWVADERLAPFRAQLRELLSEQQPVIRVLGPSGIGKSRLTLEALGPDEKEESSRVGINDLVLYATESEVGELALKAAVQSLVDSASQAVVVIDRCDVSLHEDLAAMVRRRNSRIALVTLDHEYDPGQVPSVGTIIIEAASRDVVEGVAKNARQGADDSDSQRIAALAAGFPQAARLLALAWDSSSAAANNEALVDRVIRGRRGDGRLILKASRLLSVFGIIGYRAPLDEELDFIAGLPGAPSAQELRESFEDLLHRGVAQQRGRVLTLQPLPLAQPLAARQWQQWGETVWDDVLAGSLHPKLRTRAARQLTRYNRDPFPTNIVKAVCRIGGPLDAIEKLRVEGNGSVIESFAEIDASSVVALLSRVLLPLSHDQMLGIEGDLRRNLVHALEKIVFLEDSFEQGARLMLALAAAENEKWGNNATGDFKELFAVGGGATQADGAARLRLLDETIAQGDQYSLLIATDALTEAINLQGGGVRFVGAEHHGSRPALKPWLPKTWGEIYGYVRACLERLASLSCRNNDIGARAKRGLGLHLRALVGSGMLEEAESVVAKVAQASGSWWPEALGSLGDVLLYDTEALREGEAARVQALVNSLKPTDMLDRVRFLVTEMPWDYPVDEDLEFEERERRQREDVESLAVELLQQSKVLENVLPIVSLGNQRMAHAFGASLAKNASAPLDLLDSIMAAYESVPSVERNFGTLSGYLTELEMNLPETVADFKNRASNSSVFGPTLPHVCASIGLKPTDIPLAMNAIESGYLPVSQLRLWGGGRSLEPLSIDALSPLFDKLLSRQDGYPVAVELMGMFVHSSKDKLEFLRPQLRQMAAQATTAFKAAPFGMDKHHFEEMMSWMLAKGRDDRDAAWIASSFARQIVESENYKDDAMIKPLLPKLLRDFPEVAWPIIGQAIVSEQKKAWHFELVLGDRFSFRAKKPAILDLPEEALFAWCRAHPERAPAFTARLLPVLTSNERNVANRTLHPLMKRLLDEFGDKDGVLRSVTMNMHSFGWSGSTADYYALYDEPLKPLEVHQLGVVRRWAKNTREELNRAAQQVRTEEAERDAYWGQ